MRLLYACILIAGFGLPWYWYAISAVIYVISIRRFIKIKLIELDVAYNPDKYGIYVRGQQPNLGPDGLPRRTTTSKG
jgi:hypothetical protein